jgi:hypothetical protein
MDTADAGTHCSLAAFSVVTALDRACRTVERQVCYLSIVAAQVMAAAAITV